jgi:hypothetical protein
MNVRVEVALRLSMAALFVFIGVAAALLARDFNDTARWFPYYISLAITVLATIVLAREAMTARRVWAGAPAPEADAISQTAAAPVPPALEGAEPEEDEEEPPILVNLMWWATVAAFAVCVYVVGLFVAAPIFLLLALRFGGKMRWRMALLSAVIGLLALWGLSELLQLPLPEGLLS